MTTIFLRVVYLILTDTYTRILFGCRLSWSCFFNFYCFLTIPHIYVMFIKIDMSSFCSNSLLFLLLLSSSTMLIFRFLFLFRTGSSTTFILSSKITFSFNLLLLLLLPGCSFLCRIFTISNVLSCLSKKKIHNLTVAVSCYCRPFN